MSTPAPSPNWQPPKVFSSIVKRVLPAELKETYLDALLVRSRSLREFIPDSFVAIYAAYRIQAVNAFNKVAAVAEVAATAYCFYASSMPLVLVLLMGAVLFGLFVRDGFTRRDPHDPESKPLTMTQFLMKLFGDTNSALVSLLLANGLLWMLWQGLAVPNPMFFRGVLICLPLISTLRMLLRPGPNANLPFDGTRLPAAKVRKLVNSMTQSWLLAALFVVIVNDHAMPALFPGPVGVAPFIVIVTFYTWKRLQQDPFLRDNDVFTLKDGEEAATEKQIQQMLPGFDPNDPWFVAYAALEAALFLVLALPIAMGLQPWLAGKILAVNYFKLAVNGVTLLTLLTTWNYLKKANYAAVVMLRAPFLTKGDSK